MFAALNQQHWWVTALGTPGGAIPSCQSPDHLLWSNIDQEGSKVGGLGRQMDLWAIQRSMRRWKCPSSWEDLGPKAPRLVHTLTCPGWGWMMEKCLLTDLALPSLSRITVSKNSQPVTYFAFITSNSPLSACLLLIEQTYRVT